MLSYRHGFHAGNHADVLKHWVYVQCLQYLKQKEKPFYMIDTHAGAGRYSLSDPYATKNAEARSGIERLWEIKVPEVLQDYLNVVKNFNPGPLKQYPGSPAIAMQLMRENDRLRLVEQHSTELATLKKAYVRNERVDVIAGDGFQQIKALLPPLARRGIVLMDPSYELKRDYFSVVDALEAGLIRFANGVYLIWYPLLNVPWLETFRKKIRLAAGEHWLDVVLQVKEKPKREGMYGSGMLVVNPPWILPSQLQAGLPFLLEHLGQDASAQFHLETSQSSNTTVIKTSKGKNP